MLGANNEQLCFIHEFRRYVESKLILCTRVSIINLQEYTIGNWLVGVIVTKSYWVI